MKKENDFFNDVYDVVRQIPAGRATSYGAIAAYLGQKRGARMVGWAMGNSYNKQGVPAHRVVNSQGILSARHLFGTPTAMQERLESEGVNVKNDKIQNWKERFWDPEKELH
ncbi:MGMT family protein [Dyadobacter arcticus]|uniref:Methylated-DNA-protein-cysteine methyltransferase-like protein n=1 Tax=Dyadobacter arcticus TaxID=1078754 RepID=A0ABX0UKJ5_9BACT|nr:MGMT family protein [Dyadobacter arcticus]NIJ53471.1 methylated-DNA-protein-cysteine methyltransferase-like protein [Dyadobacter arcticus]